MNLLELNDSITEIRRQEESLQWPVFNEALAWELGCTLQLASKLNQAAVHIEIEAFGRILFVCAMPGSAPSNADWARRKRNVVQLLQRSSLAIGLGLKRDDTDLQRKMGLSDRDYAPHGGCFPLRILGSGCIGSITVSGMPEFDDHALIVSVLQAWQDNGWQKPTLVLE
jgi:uncharacterized protein (UPF0303 family)